MGVLGELKATVVIHLSAVFGIGTILLCYSIAVYKHHVPVWLPMISDCAVAPPEMFPFRLGLLTAAWLMALQNVIVYLAGVPRSLLAAVLAEIGCLCLAVVSVVNENEAGRVHSGMQAILY